MHRYRIRTSSWKRPRHRFGGHFGRVLVDSSVWIHSLRTKGTLHAGDEVDVATCLPVIQELLQGVVPEKAYHTIRDMLMTMPLIESPLTAEVFDEAIHLSRLARSKGHTISSPIDCLIAACAIRNNIPVLHRDADFDAIARISTLDSRNVSRFASA